MAARFRIFTSFAIEDAALRTLLVGQARNARTPFEFVDMSVKSPWDSSWKTNCRTRIRGCDGLIAIVTPNVPRADGARWEIQCANEERIPVLGIYGKGWCTLPPELAGKRVVSWTWPNVAAFLDSL
jgi:hypothetical protein